MVAARLLFGHWKPWLPRTLLAPSFRPLVCGQKQLLQCGSRDLSDVPSALSAQSMVLNVRGEVQGPCWRVAFGIRLLR